MCRKLLRLSWWIFNNGSNTAAPRLSPHFSAKDKINRKQDTLLAKICCVFVEWTNRQEGTWSHFITKVKESILAKSCQKWQTGQVEPGDHTLEVSSTLFVGQV